MFLRGDDAKQNPGGGAAQEKELKMKVNLAPLSIITETTVECNVALMQQIIDRFLLLCPKVEGEDRRVRTYDRDAGIEFRTQNYNFDLTFQSEFRYGGKDEARLPSGDVALLCPLSATINWSGCGSRSLAETVDFSGRILMAATLAQTAIDSVVAGRRVVQVFETAKQERERAELIAVREIVAVAITEADLGHKLARKCAVVVTVSNEQFHYEDEGREWALTLKLPAKNKAGYAQTKVTARVIESGIANVVFRVERAD